MNRIDTKTRRGVARLMGLVALTLALVCCNNDGNPYGEDGDADGGGGGDTGTGECIDVEWGSGLEVEQVVANWTQSGYIDDDGDGVVEQEDVEFSLEDIHCTGKRSMVVLIGDTG